MQLEQLLTGKIRSIKGGFGRVGGDLNHAAVSKTDQSWIRGGMNNLDLKGPEPCCRL